MAAVVIATVREHEALESSGVSLKCGLTTGGERERSVADLLRSSLLSRARARTGGKRGRARLRRGLLPLISQLDQKSGLFLSTHASVVTLATGI